MEVFKAYLVLCDAVQHGGRNVKFSQLWVILLLNALPHWGQTLFVVAIDIAVRARIVSVTIERYISDGAHANSKDMINNT